MCLFNVTASSTPWYIGTSHKTKWAMEAGIRSGVGLVVAGGAFKECSSGRRLVLPSNTYSFVWPVSCALGPSHQTTSVWTLVLPVLGPSNQTHSVWTLVSPVSCVLNVILHSGLFTATSLPSNTYNLDCDIGSAGYVISMRSDTSIFNQQCQSYVCCLVIFEMIQVWMVECQLKKPNKIWHLPIRYWSCNGWQWLAVVNIKWTKTQSELNLKTKEEKTSALTMSGWHIQVIKIQTAL